MSFLCFIQEGDFDTPLLESFRNGDGATDSTRFGFFKVILKINLKPLNGKQTVFDLFAAR